MIEELLGPIPNGWEYTTLGEACKRGEGSIQTGPFGSQLHASDYVSVGIPSIMPQNIGDNRIVEDGIARITPDDASRLSRYLVSEGDIVYSRRGDVERRALVRKHENGWLCGTGCLRVRLGKSGIDPRYASFYLGNPSVREWIVRHAHGATMPNLNTSILAACPFVIPPLLEQRTIAEILSALDDKIELNRKMNATLESMARAIFKSWFVDFDPVRAKMEGRQPYGMDTDTAALFPSSFEDSELGLVPKGWKVKTVEDIAERVAMGPFGSSIKVETFVEEGVPIISGQHLRGLVLNDNKYNFITDEHAQRLRNAIVRRGDVIFTHAGNIGQAAFIPENSRYDHYVISQRQFFMRCASTEVCPEYITLYFTSADGQYRLLANASQSGVPSIARPVSYLRSIPLLISTKGIMDVFQDSVRALFVEIRDNACQSEILCQIRDYLLSKLISGEIRVGEAEKMVEAVV